MPNTLTNVQDIKVAQHALQPFTAALTPIRAFSTNFSPDPADELDTVRVPIVSPPSQSSDFAGNYTTNADSTMSVIPVQLTRHKFKTVHLTAREASETAFNVLDTLVSAAVKQLAQDVLQDIFSEITAANYGAPRHPGAGGQCVRLQKAPRDSRGVQRGEDARHRPRTDSRRRLFHESARR
jgi:hypothetical protein